MEGLSGVQEVGRLFFHELMKLFAYIDPGTGALIWQMIVSAFVGLLFYLKKTRDWIIGLFLNVFRRNPKADENTTPEKIKSKIDPS